MRSDAPVLLVVQDAPDELHRVAQALERRFGADFAVITTGTAADAKDTLERLVRDAAPVALVAAGLREVYEAIEVLRRACALHPGAVRASFLPMASAAAHGPAADAIFRAMAL